MVARASHQADNARELSSRTRLSQISHHFLSDDQPSEQPAVTPDKTPGQNPQPLILPVLMNLQQDNCFPVYALSQALLTHKKSSAVLLVEGELSSSTCSTVFKPHGDNTQNELNSYCNRQSINTVRISI